MLVVGELSRGGGVETAHGPSHGGCAGQMDRTADAALQRTHPAGDAGDRRDVGEARSCETDPPEDGLLAATALVHGLTLVTRNVKNVEGLGVPVLNPWSPSDL